MICLMSEARAAVRTVLYYNDDEQSSEEVARILQARGYRLITTSDLTEALDQIRSGTVDLVLYNINLALEEGVESLMAIKNHCPEIPVIPACPTHQ